MSTLLQSFITRSVHDLTEGFQENGNKTTAVVVPIQRNKEGLLLTKENLFSKNERDISSQEKQQFDILLSSEDNIVKTKTEEDAKTENDISIIDLIKSSNEEKICDERQRNNNKNVDVIQKQKSRLDEIDKKYEDRDLVSLKDVDIEESLEACTNRSTQTTENKHLVLNGSCNYIFWMDKVRVDSFFLYLMSRSFLTFANLDLLSLWSYGYFPIGIITLFNWYR